MMIGGQLEDMRRTWLLVLLAVAAAALVVVPMVGLAAVDSSSAQTADNGSDVAPGERMSGVVGVGEAELGAAHQQRAFGLQVAQAASDEARADAVAEQLTDAEQRLAELEQRRAELEAARENGEISDGRYRAEIARIAAQTEAVQSLGNQTGQVAGRLPTELLEQRNVSAERIQQLSSRANNLTGPEVAEIARGIAGNGVGEIPRGPPVDVPVGPDDDRPRGPPGGDDRPGGPPGEDARPGDDFTDGNVGERPDAGGNATEVTPDNGTTVDSGSTTDDTTTDDQRSDTGAQTTDDTSTTTRD